MNEIFDADWLALFIISRTGSQRVKLDIVNLLLCVNWIYVLNLIRKCMKNVKKSLASRYKPAYI